MVYGLNLVLQRLMFFRLERRPQARLLGEPRAEALADAAGFSTQQSSSKSSVSGGIPAGTFGHNRGFTGSDLQLLWDAGIVGRNQVSMQGFRFLP